MSPVTSATPVIEPTEPAPVPPDGGGEVPRVDAEEATRWADLVGRIRSDDEGAMAELYQVFCRGVRFYLCRQMGLEGLDDKVHDTFLIVLQAIKRGDVREPERLLGFIRTVVRRQVATHIDHAIQIRREHADLESGSGVIDLRQNPEQTAMLEQRAQLMEQVLKDIPARDREILVRFYIHEQPPEQICHDMNLTETQFRLLKSRAKAKFGELGRRRLARRAMARFSMRKSSGA